MDHRIADPGMESLIHYRCVEYKFTSGTTAAATEDSPMLGRLLRLVCAVIWRMATQVPGDAFLTYRNVRRVTLIY